MTEGTANWGCEQCSADLAELALGVLTGRERARALAHVDTCPDCAGQLEHLARAADTVLLAAPDKEPPMGFEVRLFDRLGFSAVTRHGHRHPRTGRRRWVPAAVASAAAAVVALGVGLGLSLSPSSPSPAPSVAPVAPSAEAPASHMESANLSAPDGRTVGHVMYSSGAKPWMSMMLSESGIHGTVNCVVVGKDGTVHKVGTMVATNGYGAWDSPLHQSPDTLRAVKVLSPSGAVVATAPLG